MQMPLRPKSKLPLYIPRIMTDFIKTTTKDSTTIHFGFGHKCHKHGRLFDLEHVRTCSELSGCPDIGKYAQILKGDINIRLWKQEVLADAILQYTQLAVQLANLTSRNLATLVHTPSMKKAPTSNKRGRPKSTEVIAKTNHKVDQFFQRKTPLINADRPMQSPEEERKQSEPSETAALSQQPIEEERMQSEQPAEESKQWAGHLRV